ncbi:MAG TPA: zinc-binding dehydrogenase, partial [Pyrinomonadaceae bacterium]
RLILVGLTSGAIVSEFNLGKILSKRARIIGTVLRSRSTLEKAEANAEFIKEVVPLFAGKKLTPNIDRVFKLEEIKKAHEYLESNESFGKVVLEI